jgi:hypothetical protein
MIDHRTAESLMAAAIDFPLSPDEQAGLDAHLAGCDQCRTVGAQLRRHSLVLGEMATEGAPMRIRSAVEAAALQAGATNQRLMLLLAAALLAAAAIGGAAVVGSGLFDLDDLSINPALPSPSSTASDAPGLCPAPSEIGASPTSTPLLQRPPLSYPPLTDAGSRATVIVDRLRVHDLASCTDFEVVAELGEGTEVLLADGPLANEGLDWYWVYFSWLPADPPYFADITFGWVAAGPTGQRPTSISIEPPRCPDTVTANVVGAMSSLARLQCLGTGPHEVTGVIQGCTDYFVTGEPEWLFTECLNLFNPDGTPSNLFIFFPPDLDTAGLDQGDVVRVVGHVDDLAASECRVAADVPTTEPAWRERELVLRCRSAFVVSEIEVTGYQELP